MNTIQLLRAVECDEVLQLHNIGVFPSDRLPKVDRDPACVIANTDPHSKTGTHWVAFYIDGNKCEFFDSYGNQPQNRHFIRFMQPYQVLYNRNQVQAPFSSACGQHVIHFLYHRCRGDKEILDCYTRDLGGNDQAVCAFVSDMCDVSIAPIDRSFVYSQIARVLQEQTTVSGRRK